MCYGMSGLCRDGGAISTKVRVLRVGMVSVSLSLSGNNAVSRGVTGGITVGVIEEYKDSTDLRVCKSPGCTHLFAVGEGSGRTSKLYCSNACKQRAYRSGGPVAKLEKLKEITARQADVRESMDRIVLALDELLAESDGLCMAAGVARGEDWQDAWEELALLREAQENRGDYEGFNTY